MDKLERCNFSKIKRSRQAFKSKRTELEEVRGLKDMLSKSLTKYGIVKYDAFDDVGGN